MIRDPTVLAEMKKEWQGVEALRGSVELDAMAAFSMPVLGGHYPWTLAKVAHNLLVVHTCSVLQEVLRALQNEGCFSCNSRFLGPLVESSEKALPWIDFARAKQIVTDRNNIAHEGKMLDVDACRRSIDAIHAELVQWQIV